MAGFEMSLLLLILYKRHDFNPNINMDSFESLEVWKKCRQFRIEISELLKVFPDEEKYRLIDQLKRSTRSITANIAEGHGRFHYLDNLKFCRNARGSLNEVLDHLICACDERIINIEQ